MEKSERIQTMGVVAFAFGVPHSITSNKRIASWAWEEARSLGVAVYTQRDIVLEKDEQ